jgi:hypothetical protein
VQPLVTAVGSSADGFDVGEIGKVLPVFLPACRVETEAWTGPHARLAAQGIVLAWGLLSADNSIQYVHQDNQREWEARGIDWKVRALENLRRLSPPPLATAALLREDEETWLISLMYPDGLGPSRLLLHDELARLFPTGYRVALPEQNRAFVFARDLDPVDADTVENIIRRSFSSSERPLSAESFAPEELLPSIRR